MRPKVARSVVGLGANGGQRWHLTLVAQTVLAARGNLKDHRQRGLSSSELTALIWCTLSAVTMLALIFATTTGAGVPVR